MASASFYAIAVTGSTAPSGTTVLGAAVGALFAGGLFAALKAAVTLLRTPRSARRTRPRKSGRPS